MQSRTIRKFRALYDGLTTGYRRCSAEAVSYGLRLKSLIPAAVMIVELHPHARRRMVERGATEDEIVATVKGGERFPARFGRTAFRRNFPHAATWRGKPYAAKQLEVYALEENDRWLVITLVVKFF